MTADEAHESSDGPTGAVDADAPKKPRRTSRIGSTGQAVEAAMAAAPEPQVQRPPTVSLAAVQAGDRDMLKVLSPALAEGGFFHYTEDTFATALGRLKRYLGGADDRHALTWLALRTQSFTLTD